METTDGQTIFQSDIYLQTEENDIKTILQPIQNTLINPFDKANPKDVKHTQ